MTKETITFRGLFTDFYKTNTGKRFEVFYNEFNNNMLVFTPRFKSETLGDIINSTHSGYDYLVDKLNTTKNLVVHWIKAEGTTSDYVIHNDFDPKELLGKSYRDIVKLIDGSIKDNLNMKYIEVKNGLSTPIHRLDGAKRHVKLYVGVDYEEFETNTYRGVFLREGITEVLRFNTGDFLTDLSMIEKEIPKLYPDVEDYITLSSVDHYQMDGEDI